MHALLVQIEKHSINVTILHKQIISVIVSFFFSIKPKYSLTDIIFFDLKQLLLVLLPLPFFNVKKEQIPSVAFLHNVKKS